MYSLAANLRKCAAEGREFTSGYTRRTSKGTKGLCLRSDLDNSEQVI